MFGVVAGEVTMLDEPEFIVTAIIGDALVLAHGYDLFEQGTRGEGWGNIVTYFFWSDLHSMELMGTGISVHSNEEVVVGRFPGELICRSNCDADDAFIPTTQNLARPSSPSMENHH